MTPTEEHEMHALAVQLAKLTEGEGWEAMRYGAVGSIMQKLSEYCACVCELDHKSALLASQTGAQGWQDISTAPKDGTRVLLHPGPNGYSVVGRLSLTNRWWECLPGKYQIQPTFWMPLPPLPEEPQP